MTTPTRPPYPPVPPAPRRRRRSPARVLLAVTAAVVGFVLLLVGGGLAVAWFALRPIDTVGEVEFDRALAVPPLAESRVDEQGRRVFSLTAQEGRSDLGGSGTAATWGFNGAHLGPTLRAGRGEQVRVEVDNELPKTTSVHWHGMHLPAAMDGGPHQPVEPGGTWTPEWTVDQPAATLWYHPHPHGETADHVARGLAGMFILDDPVEQALDLPREYGVDDVPVIVQDVSLEDSGRLEEGRDRGSTVLVNGTVGPYLEVTTERVRLRLLNASIHRTYAFGLDDGSPLVQIASDGGLLPEPHRTDAVLLSPGERAEVVVTMQPGETRVLRSQPGHVSGGGLSDRQVGGADRLDVMQLRAAAELQPSPEVPDPLVPDIADHAGDEADAVRTRSFELQGRQINGKRMDMERIDEVVGLGDTEVWEVRNAGGEPHSFHVHDVQFHVLGVDGREPGPGLAGLKDTVLLAPGSTMRLLMTFRDHAGPAGDTSVPYMYHCHLLRHEDEGMMGQFVVAEDGELAGPGTGGAAGAATGHGQHGRHDH
ncbi:multicopper oxidase family protein [Ornithinicoccus halotolerans]|uniref:multicopper oxidase family protein n=1 Tax=Ornithinicoccus halotolerans TaxID=1748220 RepID=UPI001E2F648E|nr:multicopper oxidase domain-containing protein [Ornithinicoccus halotolerans]